MTHGEPSVTGSDAPALYEVADGVATITLNRPERWNVWTDQMQQLYSSHLRTAADDNDVKVIVVTGAGPAFCAGVEMDMIQSFASEEGKDMRVPGGALTQKAETEIPKPIIAAINGACAGLGFVRALMCDLRFAARGAKFATAFSRRGLVAEHGTSWLLPRMIGVHRAFDLLVSGRKFDAEEAYELGLLNGLSEPESLLDDVYAYARDLAANASPTAMAAIKYQIYRHQQVDFDSALYESFAMLERSLRREDIAEGSASFLEKRSPVFPPLSEFRSM
jgi:enoyl-CoA hydratase/carnithine racemase